MTTSKMIKPQVIPDWDLMKWKEETQRQIYEKTKDMTSEEVLAYFHQAAERAARRRAEREQSLSDEVQE